MFCPKCGCTLDNDTKFCSKCGTDITVPQASQPLPMQHQEAHKEMPVKTNNSSVPSDKPLSIWQYVGIFLLSAIPILGIILIFKWAFGRNVNINKKNYSRAVLIMFLIGIILSIVISIVYGSILASLFEYTNSIPLN